MVKLLVHTKNKFLADGHSVEAAAQKADEVVSKMIGVLQPVPVFVRKGHCIIFHANLLHCGHAGMEGIASLRLFIPTQFGDVRLSGVEADVTYPLHNMAPDQGLVSLQFGMKFIQPL
eukprot:353723-Chlamydomonas_euryale.AAC.3